MEDAAVEEWVQGRDEVTGRATELARSARAPDPSSGSHSTHLTSNFPISPPDLADLRRAAPADGVLGE